MDKKKVVIIRRNKIDEKRYENYLKSLMKNKKKNNA
jgi:hypothetical protein